MVMWGEPWPETAREWEFYAVCSQLKADQRRQEAWEERQAFRREITSMLKGAGTVLGILASVAVAYVMAWGLWAVAG